MGKKKTAVDYIKEQLLGDEYWFEKLTFEQIIIKAKKIEKECIKDAWNNGNEYVIKSDGKTSEKYYNNTFGGDNE